MKTDANKPFGCDAEYLQAEIEGWMTARCLHVAARKQLAEAGVSANRNITVVGHEDMTACEELRRRIAKLAVGEADIRAEIDARIAATKAVGTDLALERLCREHDLDSMSRATLLLCFSRTVPGGVAEPLEQIGLFGFNEVTLDLVARFCELDFAERVGLRLVCGAEGRLVRAGLVTVGLGYTAGPGDWPSASLGLTATGWSAMAGLPLTADMDE